ncbi:MAG TPA: macro domain-containing protein [Candidatus Limnocylindrales bacterium]|jgi:O-acetyl-ADP-ribose deacetylase (regulator of RNase III)
MADIALWNGDICDLEVDAIVSPASTSLWMATGVAGAIKRRGGDAIEFAAVRQGPVGLGEAVATDAGSLAARWVIHAVSLDWARRTDAVAIDRAVRNAFARARELGAETLAIPALGTGVGGFPMAEGARAAVAAVRAELARSPRITRVTFALRGAAAYEAFRLALTAPAASPAGVLA